jgi:hypothetical protein
LPFARQESDDVLPAVHELGTMRQRESIEYASDTRAGSRLFQASSASRTFCDALSRVNGGNGGSAAGS